MADKTNKINVYLIKEGVERESIFKTPIDELKRIEGYDLYYNPKVVIPAPWVKSFFKTDFKDDNRVDIFNAASSQAVLVRNITIDSKDLTFAICFGTGYHMLNKDAYESKFGLITTLNLVNQNNLRKIDKHDISGTPKFTAEQLSKRGSQLDFGLNVELDILQGVVASLNRSDPDEAEYIETFGTTLSGKANLNINAKIDIDDLDELLEASYKKFNSTAYQDKGFAWINKIEAVKKDSSKYNQLEDKLDECLQNDNTSAKLWLSIPELIEWQDVSGFYFNNDKNRLSDDITFDAFKDACGDELNLENLRKTRVKALHSNGSRAAYTWTAYQCLYAEISLSDETYILINSDWYKISQDFLEQTESKYVDIRDNHKASIEFVSYQESDDNENGYNERMTEQLDNAICMDAKNISHGGVYDKVEFCDIFDPDNKNIIHIKKYSGSSVLSHLFAQGLVSAQLLLSDSDFREKVVEKINEIQETSFSFSETISGYNVVFGIIAKRDTMNIPFFSKVNLNNVFTQIRSLRGFNVSFAFIDKIDPEEIDA